VCWVLGCCCAVQVLGLSIYSWWWCAGTHNRSLTLSFSLFYYFVQNGDLNWIIKDKILAFAGPSFERHVSPEGYCTLAPGDYIPYFQRRNVGLVVRLNKKMYHESDFIDAGIDHLEAYFLDGSCPPMHILENVLEAFESVDADKAFAVHCKAGLGRTGSCIGAYMMKHYRFTATEAIAWMRICRPGMVIGPQQHFLKQIEQIMWQAGASQKIDRHLLTNLEPMNNDVAPDAVEGRAGQAESLLAARLRRALAPAKPAMPVTTTAGPMTPEQPSRDKAAMVTPDSKSSKPRLWLK
jgi:protein-tyrosine phosphatase